jgi:glycosyltransferase involved in cell wall biosynthesis
MFSTYFPPQYSGAAKQAISLAKHLRKRGHHIEFATVRWPGLSSYEIFDGFSVHRVNMGRGQKHREFYLWFNLLILVLRRRHDFDLFHSHGAYYTNSIVSLLARLVGWKSLVKASLTDNDLSGIKLSLAGHIHYSFLRKVDACVAISHDLEAEFISAGIPAERVHYVPNGVDTTRFRPVGPEEKAVLRKAFGLPLDRPVVLSIGVFDQRKNLGWLVENWVQRDAFDTNAFLLVVGPQSREDQNGAFFSSFKQMAAEKCEILRLMDHVDEIEKLYRTADLFILPSRSEGMPNVILEAMASGLPCLATKVSGSRELIEERKTGFTFAVDDVQDFRHAFLNIFHGKRRNMGERARKKVEKEFSLPVIAERYERLYKKLLVCG